MSRQVTRFVLVLALLGLVSGPGCTRSGRAPAAVAATSTPSKARAVPPQPAGDDEMARYATREKSAGELARFEGGRTDVTTIIIVLLLVIVILILI